MSDAEAKLAAFWREDRPKASDVAFRLAVLERRARAVSMSIRDGWLQAAYSWRDVWLRLRRTFRPSSVSQPMPGAIPVLSVVLTGACMLLAYMRSRQTF